NASYPLVIDPLTQAVSIASGAGVVEDVTIGAFPNAMGRNTLIAHSRHSSATDLDLFVTACADDYSLPLLVYSDADTNWSSALPPIAACEGASRWVVAFQRDFTGPSQSSIRAYVHQLNNATPFSGSELIVTLNFSNTHRRVQVGGSTGGNGKKA